MDLSIIIVSYNTKDLTLSCIKSIKKFTDGIEYEIIVIDNASIDGSAQEIEGLGVAVIKNASNIGFAAANNQGTALAKGQFTLFLNSDTLVSDNVLGEMVNYVKKHSEVDIASCALKNKDGSLQATGGYFPTLPRVFSWMTIQDFPYVDKLIKPFHPLHAKSFFSRGDEFYSRTKELDWVTGAFLLIKKGLLEKIGGWDENYFMYVEEVDLCFRAKKVGAKVWYLPKWNIVHLGGASSKTSEFALINEYKGIKRFYRKHFPIWQYFLARTFLKIGALGRIVLFGILEGADVAKTYAKAFKIA